MTKKLSALMTAAAAIPLSLALNVLEIPAHGAEVLEQATLPASVPQEQTPTGKIYKFTVEEEGFKGEYLIYISDAALDFIRDHAGKTFEDMSAGGLLTELVLYSGVEPTDAMVDGKRIPAEQYFEKDKLVSLVHYLKGKQQDASENDPCYQKFDINTGRINKAHTCTGGNTRRQLSNSELLKLNISKGLAPPEDRIPKYLRDRIVPGATLPQP